MINNEDILHFDENKAFEKFKTIRNRIRKHYPHEIVISCIQMLNKKTNNHAYDIRENRHYPPWFLYLLIKWTIKYGEYLSPDRKSLTEKDFIYLINLIHDLFAVQRGPNDYGSIYLFFRTIAYQQFWLQESFIINRLGRQILLFNDLPDNHYFNTLFYQENKITIHNFLELSFALLAHFESQNEMFVTSQWFLPIMREYPKGTVEGFLSMLSLDWDKLKNYLEAQPKTSVAYEFHEQTPLRRFPLLKVSEKYYCYSLQLLSACIQNVIYDLLRQKDVSKFMEKFGNMFEQYVGKAITYGDISFYKEAQLKEMLNTKNKIVDFIICESDANIFIDAKGVEINSIGMISHLPEIVTDKTKTSVLKGVEQYFSTVNTCIETGIFDVNSKMNYFLIVTYKDLYLGNGKDIFDNIAPKEYNEIRSKYNRCEFLESENIYIISIDDFDLLMELIKSGKKSLSEVLNYAVNSDRNMLTKKFLFRQHINEINDNINYVGYLGKQIDTSIFNFSNKIQNLK